MLDHLLGVILLGLGISANPSMPAVKGESTDVTETVMPTITPTPTWRPWDEKVPAQLERNVGKLFEAKRKKFQDDVTKKEQDAQSELTKKKEAFQTKLTEIKDTKKQKILTYINDKLTTINKNRTDKMTAMLKKMSEVLEKLTARAASAKAAGTDTSAVDQAITDAQTALTAAQNTVAAQAGKTYVLTITSETTAKNDVGTAMSGLESDLKAVNTQVMAVYQALRKAISALTQITGGAEPTSTPTGGPTP